MFIFKYGSHAHDAGEVDVQTTRQAIRGRRGFVESIRTTMQLAGKLHADSATELTTKIRQLEAAYVDGKDATLFHADGTTPTAHRLINSQSLGGVRVVSGPNWGPGEGAEYTTYRSYTITLEADVAQLDQNVIDFEETVITTGSGGPRMIWVETLLGSPKPQIVNQRTITRTVQSGTATGLLLYPSPPGPLFPGFLDQPNVRIQRYSPRRVRGSFRDFRISWSYPFIFGGAPLPALPNRL